MNTSDIETILTHAPLPKASAGLRDRLCAQAAKGGIRASNSHGSSAQTQAGWIRRWWPALAPAAVSLACATVFTFQQREIRELKEPLANSQETIHAAAQAESFKAAISSTASSASTTDNDEITRLQGIAAQLRSEISQLEQIRSQNDALRKELATRAANRLSQDETKALEDASQNALSIQCINNMKQLGLMVRMWANDNADTTPAEVQNLADYAANALKVFICPADKSRTPATNRSSLSAATCSYEYLAPTTLDNESNRVLFRCPIHGHIGLMDGSVQKSIVKEHPEWLVQRDGKLYMDATIQAPGGPR